MAPAVNRLRAGEDLGPHLLDVHRLKDDADQVVRRALASLFAQSANHR